MWKRSLRAPCCSRELQRLVYVAAILDQLERSGLRNGVELICLVSFSVAMQEVATQEARLYEIATKFRSVYKWSCDLSESTSLLWMLGSPLL